jgi:hypothetical protein
LYLCCEPLCQRCRAAHVQAVVFDHALEELCRRAVQPSAVARRALDAGKVLSTVVSQQAKFRLAKRAAAEFVTVEPPRDWQQIQVKARLDRRWMYAIGDAPRPEHAHVERAAVVREKDGATNGIGHGTKQCGLRDWICEQELVDADRVALNAANTDEEGDKVAEADSDRLDVEDSHDRVARRRGGGVDEPQRRPGQRFSC